MPFVSRLPRPEVGFLLFAAAFAVFHHVPSYAGPAQEWVDHLTPLAVIGTAALVLVALRAAPAALVLALVAGVIYVNGHGIHLSANAIGREELTPELEDVVHFWDEVWGHIWWHLGWVLLVGALCLAEALARGPHRRRPPSLSLTVASIVLLGATLFTSGVEGGTWWLVAAAVPVFVVWAARAPRPLVVTAAGAFALAGLLMAVWAVWHGGMPQFSDVGLL